MRNRVTFLTKGGFGNQLFQLATALNLSIMHDLNFKMNNLPRKATDKYHLDILGISANKTYRAFIDDGKLEIRQVQQYSFGSATAWHESSFEYIEIPTFTKNTLIDGYFQSYKYFADIQTELREWLLCKLQVSHRAGTETVQVRIGDLLHNSEMLAFHGLLPERYFLSNIKKYNFASNLNIVTDDKQGLIKNFPLLANFMDKNQIQNDFLADFVSIASSSKVIISNSTFGWWGAFLSSGLVVFPRNWFSADNVLNELTDDLGLPNWNRE
jgi:hypothetical protein